MKKVHEEVEAALKQSKDEMKEVYNHHHQDACVYEKGQKVWIEATNLKSNRPSPALNERHYGPFEILKKIGASAYRIAIPPTWDTHDVFSESILTPYREPRYTNQQQPPPPEPDMVEHDDGEISEEHEVEAVINS